MERTTLEQITHSQFYGTATLDPRCKLLLLISIGVVSYILVGDVASISLMIGFSLFVSFGEMAGWAFKTLIIYVAVAYLNALLRYVSIPVLSVVMSVFGVTVLKMVPIIMVGRWIMKTTHMDDLMVSLQRLKLPQSVTIPLTVSFRYIPTLAIEYSMIRNTMAIRGICDTIWKKLARPIQTVEYILIPLLMRCLTVTDELAASGTTRGLEREEKRYAINDVRFSIKEYATTAAAIAALVTLVVIDRSSIGEVVVWRV
ncbi:MAG: energy-coupling factor transporter transmembrane protein EcfT [Clostridiales bacterium]|jgi:energy-coupling factor transport system permease protein|nr:energy-coupling factor transporter transmembrane protein EcfT [Clostridiales bacterium]